MAKLAIIKEGIIYYIQNNTGLDISEEDIEALLTNYVKTINGNSGVVNDGNSVSLSHTIPQGDSSIIGVDQNGSQLLALNTDGQLLHSVVLDKNGAFYDGKKIATLFDIIQDIQVNGTSVLDDNIAKITIPEIKRNSNIPTTSDLIDKQFGIDNTNGEIYLNNGGVIVDVGGPKKLEVLKNSYQNTSGAAIGNLAINGTVPSGINFDQFVELLCTGTISDIHVENVLLQDTSSTLIVGTPRQLVAFIIPTNATNQGLTWNSSDPSIATVVNGLVTPLKNGSVTISVTTDDGNKVANKTFEVLVPVLGITLNETTWSLTAGQTKQLIATITPSNASNKNIVWSSSDSLIATVSPTGLVTTIKAGNVTIKATTVDGSLEASCVFSIAQQTVAVTGVTLNKSSLTLDIGKSETLIATVNPTNATNKNVTWESSNPSIATVISGVVTPIAEGNVTITVKTNDGNFQSTCSLEVTIPVKPVTGVSLNKNTLTLIVGNTETLVATVSPTDATNKNVTWESSNTTIATVVNGLVTTLSTGNTTITVKTNDGNFQDSCVLEVEAVPIVLVDTLTLNKNSSILEVGQTEQLLVTIGPENADNKTVTWSSSDTSIATVSNTGFVTSLAIGDVIITVTANDESGLSTNCNYEIIPIHIPVTGIILNKVSGTLDTGTAELLVATVSPDNATNKSITWISSNDDIATVSSEGMVTPISIGNVTITAKTNDGDFEATCSYLIEQEGDDPVTNISLNHTNVSLDINGTVSLLVTILPSYASNKKVTWESSDNTVIAITSSSQTTCVLKALKEGQATITVTSDNRHLTASCNITSNFVHITSILIKSNGSLNIGGTEQLGATYEPLNSTNKTIIWTSSDENIATVDSTGLVTAIAVGDVIITATSEDGNKTSSCSYEITDDDWLPVYASLTKEDSSAAKAAYALDKTAKSIVSTVYLGYIDDEHLTNPIELKDLGINQTFFLGGVIRPDSSVPPNTNDVKAVFRIDFPPGWDIPTLLSYESLVSKDWILPATTINTRTVYHNDIAYTQLYYTTSSNPKDVSLKLQF